MEVFSWGMAMRCLKSAWSPRKNIWRVRFDPSQLAPAEHSLREGIIYIFSGWVFFFPSFLLHLPLLSAFGCLLGFFFRFHFSASILFLCFSACLLFCFFASLLFFFFAASASSASSAFLLLCFSASLLLCFFAFLLLCFSASLLFRFFASLLLRFLFAMFFSFCFSAFCCFFASRLVCFRFSAFLLLWVFLFCFGVCFISLLFCVWCAWQKHCYFPIKAISHESIHRDLYAHDKDCHYEMDDHTLYNYHVLTLAHMVLVL